MFVTFCSEAAPVIISAYTLSLLMVNCLLKDTSKGTVMYYNYSAVHRKRLSISF